MKTDLPLPYCGNIMINNYRINIIILKKTFLYLDITTNALPQE